MEPLISLVTVGLSLHGGAVRRLVLTWHFISDTYRTVDADGGTTVWN
jgi:hypothetical protein